MKYSLIIKFPSSETEFVFSSYSKLLRFLRKNLIKDTKKFKDDCHLWEYTINVIKEGGSI